MRYAIVTCDGSEKRSWAIVGPVLGDVHRTCEPELVESIEEVALPGSSDTENVALLLGGRTQRPSIKYVDNADEAIPEPEEASQEATLVLPS
jgi:hypothetical protein